MRKLVATFSLALTAQAGIIFQSGDGLNEYNTGGANVVLEPHNLWATGPGEWVGYRNTGVGPGAFSPPNDWRPIARFFETLDLAGSLALSLTVFADDTANVYLDGSLIIPLWPDQDGACAAGAPGCEVGEGATVALDLAPGAHELSFDVFQRAGGPTGLRYFAEDRVFIDPRGVPPSEVPEPGTLLLAGIGLVAIALARAAESR